MNPDPQKVRRYFEISNLEFLPMCFNNCLYTYSKNILAFALRFTQEKLVGSHAQNSGKNPW